MVIRYSLSNFNVTIIKTAKCNLSVLNTQNNNEKQSRVVNNKKD